MQVDQEIPPNERELYGKGDVIIGNNIWTGGNVCIMPGVKIRNSAIIGANAVVTHDITDGKTAVDVPSKIIQ